jgi:uncharacterized protein (TIGR03435 family)
MAAYDVLPDQIEGPAWLTDTNSYVYSVAVTMDPKTTREQFRSMLQELLAERFHLRLHHETRTRPGYELVTARGGTKMREWAPPTDGAPSRNSGAVAGFPQLAATGTGLAMQVRQLGMPVQIHMRDSMAALCRMLGTQISLSNGDPMMGPQPRVVDRTGLPGIYEFTLEYATAASSSAAMSASPAGGEPTAAATIEPTGSAVPIFTALEQQLGLKLNKVKAVAVDVLVIDSADKVPVENWFLRNPVRNPVRNPGTAPDYTIAESGEPRLPGQSGMVVNMIN